MSSLIPVILSGGAGSRLWPLSRELTPKQLLPLVGTRTMLQETALRAARVPGSGAPIVICNDEHRFMVAEQLRGGCAAAAAAHPLLLEPIGRNTAPAIAVAALQALEASPGESPVLLVLPADHVIRDVERFAAVAADAAAVARMGRLVTFGVVPTRAETGYGYIRAGDALPLQGLGTAPRAVAAFVEKPDAATAQRYLDSGEYFWNSGMFAFRADVYLDELGALQPAMLAACREAYARAQRDRDFVRLDAAAFGSAPAISVDYAVMEHTTRAAVLPFDAGWSDVGAWDAVWAEGAADALGNVASGDVILDGARGNYVHGDARLVALVGVDDLVVVDTKDALLVAHKARAQDVKNVVAKLKANGRSEATLQRRVARPWGTYEGLDLGSRHQVKRITVKPGQQLSLQKHAQRAEHWIVVEGTARVHLDGREFDLQPNESTYIPIGSVHRLANHGTAEVVMIEVQTGGYLGEDDIVRLEDNYGRVPS